MADETAAVVTVALPAADWARLRECLGHLAGYADGYARQTIEALATPPRDASAQPTRFSRLRDLETYLTLARDARRLSQAVGRRVAAKTGDA